MNPLVGTFNTRTKHLLRCAVHLKQPTPSLFYCCFLYCKSSYLIVQQFLIEADVHGVEGPSSARPIVFVGVHAQVAQAVCF